LESSEYEKIIPILFIEKPKAILEIIIENITYIISVLEIGVMSP
jgi:hypothetical protein